MIKTGFANLTIFTDILQFIDSQLETSIELSHALEGQITTSAGKLNVTQTMAS